MPARKDQDFVDFVIDQLSRLPNVAPRRMFGGVGLYQKEVFFAMIDEGRLYFLTDQDSRQEYESRGMKPFEYAPGKVLASYFEVPVDILEDDQTLCTWAQRAVSAQMARRWTRESVSERRPDRPARRGGRGGGRGNPGGNAARSKGPERRDGKRPPRPGRRRRSRGPR